MASMASFSGPSAPEDEPEPEPVLIHMKYVVLGNMVGAMQLALRAGGYVVKPKAPIWRAAAGDTAYLLLDATDGREPEFFAVPLHVAEAAGLVTPEAFAEVDARNTPEQRAREAASLAAGAKNAGPDGAPKTGVRQLGRDLGDSAGDVAGALGAAFGKTLGIVGSIFGEGVKGALLAAGPVPVLVGIVGVSVAVWVAVRR